LKIELSLIQNRTLITIRRSPLDNLLGAALDSMGIPYPRREVAEGRFTRWGKNSRYWAKAVGTRFVYGDYATGISESVFSKSEFNKKAWTKARRKVEADKAKADWEAATVKALQVWNDSTPISGNGHPYLKAKGVDSFGLRAYGNRLIVSLYDIAGSLSNIQYIYYDYGTSDCKKRFQPECRARGCSYSIGEETEKSCLVEGKEAGKMHENSIYLFPELFPADFNKISSNCNAGHATSRSNQSGYL
jgi:hypothetical protein